MAEKSTSSDTRLGVYICHCGINIAHTVDVEKVAEVAAGLPGVAIAKTYPYMCSDPGQSRRSPRLFDSDPLRLQRFERRSGERFRGAS